MEQHHDLIVLGGGPGGYLAAERAGDAGLDVLLVEKRYLGGVCLNEGCIPTKTLLHSAKLLHAIQDSEAYGISCPPPVFHHDQVVARKNRVVHTLVSGVAASLRQAGVAVLMEEGRIEGRSGGRLLVRVGDELHTSDYLILATGSRPVLPPIPGLAAAMERGFVLTSDALLDQTRLPDSLAVIGGGVIGAEMASYFAMAGVPVTVLEQMDKIAGPMDAGFSALLQKELERQGITFRLNAKVTGIGEGVLTVEQDGASGDLPCGRILLSAGRRSVTQGFGLETLDVAAAAGGITIDEHCSTSLPNVYAVGDCTGRSMLAHTAYRQAEVAVNNILGRRDRMRYDAVPSVIYTSPELASVGLTEEGARALGRPIAVTTLPMAYAGRYVAEHDDASGACKLIFDTERKILLGAHVLGAPASEFILACGILIETEMTLSHMKELIFPHPTVCEILREAMFRVKL